MAGLISVYRDDDVSFIGACRVAVGQRHHIRSVIRKDVLQIARLMYDVPRLTALLATIPTSSLRGLKPVPTTAPSVLRCHSAQSCGLEPARRQATQPADDCLSCHMPKRTVTTITHAALTDHSIPARSAAGQPIPESEQAEKPKLLLLTAIPDKHEQTPQCFARWLRRNSERKRRMGS